MSLSVLKCTGVSYIPLLEVKDALSGRDLRTASFADKTGELTSKMSKESVEKKRMLCYMYTAS